MILAISMKKLYKVKAKDSNFIIQKKMRSKIQVDIIENFINLTNRLVCLFDLTAICHTLFELQRV